MLARGVALEGSGLGTDAVEDCDDVCEVEPPGDVLKYEEGPEVVGDGSREESGVLTGVLSLLEYRSAGGTQPDGLPGSLAEWECACSSYAGGEGTVPGIHDE